MQIALAVVKGQRPVLPTPEEVEPFMRPLLALCEKCWIASPKDRPTFDDIITVLERSVSEAPPLPEDGSVVPMSHEDSHEEIRKRLEEQVRKEWEEKMREEENRRQQGEEATRSMREAEDVARRKREREEQDMRKRIEEEVRSKLEEEARHDHEIAQQELEEKQTEVEEWPPARPPAENGTTWTFECGTLAGWRKTGTAFDNQPTVNDSRASRRRNAEGTAIGKYWIGTCEWCCR